MNANARRLQMLKARCAVEPLRVRVDAELTGRLRESNGRRRQRTLSKNALLSDIATVAARRGDFAWTSGGTVPNNYGYRAYTTVALVHRAPDGSIWADVAECDANKTTPGRCWRDLQPWRDTGPAGATSDAKWRAWRQGAVRVAPSRSKRVCCSAKNMVALDWAIESGSPADQLFAEKMAVACQKQGDLLGSTKRRRKR